MADAVGVFDGVSVAAPRVGGRVVGDSRGVDSPQPVMNNTSRTRQYIIRAAFNIFHTPILVFCANIV